MILQGVIPILATPFHDDETLDLDSWTRLIEFMIAARRGRNHHSRRPRRVQPASRRGARRSHQGRSRRGTRARAGHRRHQPHRHPGRSGFLAHRAGSRRRRGDGDAGQRAGTERRSHRRALSAAGRGPLDPDHPAGPPGVNRRAHVGGADAAAAAQCARHPVRQGRSGADRAEGSPAARRIHRAARDDSHRARRALRAVRPGSGIRRVQHRVRISRSADRDGRGGARLGLAAGARSVFAVRAADRVRAAARRGGSQGTAAAARPAGVGPCPASGRDDYRRRRPAARSVARTNAARR